LAEKLLQPVLAFRGPRTTTECVRAVYGAAVLAQLQGDLPTGSARVAEARALVEQVADPLVHGLVDIAEGMAADGRRFSTRIRAPGGC
jgi:hypothetical protein